MTQLLQDDLKYIQRELSSLEKQIEVWGIDKTTFICDEKKRNVFFSSLDGVEEVLRQLPENLVEQLPEIPWQAFTENWEHLIQQDLVAEIEKIWDVLVDSIPNLIEVIDELLVSGEIE